MGEVGILGYSLVVTGCSVDSTVLGVYGLLSAQIALWVIAIGAGDVIDDEKWTVPTFAAKPVSIAHVDSR